MHNQDGPSTSSANVGSSNAHLDLSANAIEAPPSMNTRKKNPSNGKTPSPSKKRKRSDAPAEPAVRAGSTPTTDAVPNLEDMRAARVAALQEQEKEQKLNPVVDDFVMPRRQRQKREPKQSSGKERPKRKEKRQEKILSAQEIKRQAAKDLRNTQYSFFLAELEQTDRNDPDLATGEAYTARSVEREKEAHQRLNLVNTAGLKKTGKIRERAELVERLADAGIEVWDQEKADAIAKAEASDRGLPEMSGRQKPPATKAQIKKRRQKCHNLQHRVLLHGMERLEKSVLGNNFAKFEEGAESREATAADHVKLVNTRGVKKKTLIGVREAALDVLAAANVPVWYTDANQPEPVEKRQEPVWLKHCGVEDATALGEKQSYEGTEDVRRKEIYSEDGDEAQEDGNDDGASDDIDVSDSGPV